MIFISHQAKSGVCSLLLIALLLSSGCQLLGISADETPLALQSPSLAAGEARLSLNPYLSNRPKVPVAAQRSFELAQQAINDQSWQEAATRLKQLTEDYSELSGPYVNLALVTVELNDLAAAELAFKQAIVANRNNVSAYNHYGIFLRRQGRFNEARDIFLQALERWPDYPDGNLNIAILYDLYQGEYQLALQHYQHYQALQDNPSRQLAGWIVDLQRRIKTSQRSL